MTLKLIESPESDLAQRIQRARALATVDLRQAHREVQRELGQLLSELRAEMNGTYAGFVRTLLGPDSPSRLSRPDAYAKRLIQLSAAPLTPADAQRNTGPSAGGEAASSPHSTQPNPPAVLDEKAARLFSRLAPLRHLPGREKRRALLALAEELGVSERALYRQLRRLQQDGAEALGRKRRSDAGKTRLPDQIAAEFLRWRTQPENRSLNLAVAARLLQARFPGQDISLHSLRRLDGQIPALAKMTPRERRILTGPTGRWENAYANHTHVIDMAWADLLVWDGDPRVRPYRPRFTSVIDEDSGSLMYGYYHKGDAGTAELQTALLHAWLPKPEREWIQFGLPDHIHCDNGKVQTSHWMQEICQALSIQLHLTTAYSPWQQGHVESWHGVLHLDFEARFTAAYCGSDRKGKPAGYVDPDSVNPSTWGQHYPTLERLNELHRLWVWSEYHQRPVARHHDQTHDNVWKLRVNGHLRLPKGADAYLYATLLQRADRGGRRTVYRGGVSNLAMIYEDPVLLQYETCSVEVRWDPADLTRVLALDPVTGNTICWAERQKVFEVNNPADLAERRQIQQRRKEQLAAIDTVKDLAAGADRETFQELTEQIAAARRQSGIQDFPKRAQETEEPTDTLTLEDLARGLVSLPQDEAPEPEDPAEEQGRVALAPGLEL